MLWLRVCLCAFYAATQFIQYDERSKMQPLMGNKCAALRSALDWAAFAGLALAEIMYTCDVLTVKNGNDDEPCTEHAPHTITTAHTDAIPYPMP